MTDRLLRASVREVFTLTDDNVVFWASEESIEHGVFKKQWTQVTGFYCAGGFVKRAIIPPLARVAKWGSGSGVDSSTTSPS